MDGGVKATRIGFYLEDRVLPGGSGDLAKQAITQESTA